MALGISAPNAIALLTNSSWRSQFGDGTAIDVSGNISVDHGSLLLVNGASINNTSGNVRVSDSFLGMDSLSSIEILFERSYGKVSLVSDNTMVTARESSIEVSAGSSTAIGNMNLRNANVDYDGLIDDIGSFSSAGYSSVSYVGTGNIFLTGAAGACSAAP